MKKFIVWYNGWGIEVIAERAKQARYRAWLKFHDAYGTSFIDFVKGIEEVDEVA